jgi:membrane associated rhomboid family serine protease
MTVFSYLSSLWTYIQVQGRLLGSLALGLIGFEIANQMCNHAISEFLGLRPRSFQGIIGIFTSHFLHGDFTHLITNLIPLLTLAGLILLRNRRDFFWATGSIILASGIGTWCAGQSGSIHVGCSGLVFGYLGFLFTLGILERSLISILSAIGVTLLYHSLLWGLLPFQKGISWEMHTFGFMGGIWSATTLVRILKKP